MKKLMAALPMAFALVSAQPLAAQDKSPSPSTEPADAASRPSFMKAVEEFRKSINAYLDDKSDPDNLCRNDLLEEIIDTGKTAVGIREADWKSFTSFQKEVALFTRANGPEETTKKYGNAEEAFQKLGSMEKLDQYIGAMEFGVFDKMLAGLANDAAEVATINVLGCLVEDQRNAKKPAAPAFTVS